MAERSAGKSPQPDGSTRFDFPARAGRLIETVTGGRIDGAPGQPEVEALLVTNLVNVAWLTGFTGTNGACLIDGERRLFLTDFRYTERAAVLPGWEVEILAGDWLKALAGLLRGRVGVEDDHLTLRDANRMRELTAEGTEIVPAGGAVEALRRVKEPAEIEAIATAAALTDSIYLEVADRGLTGRSEAEVAAYVVARMRAEGAEPSFPPIVAAGPNGASPHAEPGNREIRAGELVTIDMGATLDGYCSDCTRTFASGEEKDLDGLSREIYSVTLTANLEGLGAVRAGAVGKEVDGVARAVIETAGYGEHFGHGLGHGVGLEVHEAPRLGPRSSDVLVSGEVVTVEPGIYLPGKTGVRIEDLVVVGNEGVARNMSSLPKEITFVG